MSTKICVLCGKAIDCSFHDIACTICCKDCCENVSEPDDKKRCCASRAMSEFGCRPSDLEQLDCLLARNPHYRSSAPMRLYLIAEVKHLGEIARSLKEEKANLKRQKEEEDRIIKRQRLESRWSVVVHQIRPILRPFVLGDYLQSSKSKTLLRDVKRRYSVKDRASDLMEYCKAHPISALSFCIDHPQGTVKTYCELRENMRKVFSIEGNKIMHKLSPATRKMLESTPLEDVLRQFQNRDSKTLLLKQLEGKVGIEVAKKIINFPACQQRIDRGGEEIRIAEKLISFWNSKDNKEQRRVDLEVALFRRCLKLRDDSSFCKEYINGGIDVDLDEIVGIMDITSRLFRISHLAWSHYRHSCEEEFRRCLIDEQMTLNESVNTALKKIPKRIPDRIADPELYHGYHYSSDEDY